MTDSTSTLKFRPRGTHPTLLAALVALVLAGACGQSEGAEGGARANETTDEPDSAAILPTPSATVADEGPVANLPANELGEILVLEYHRLGDSETEYVRSVENFKKDISSLYAAGFRPVTMRQVLEGNIDTPAGTTPVVFTIDDSSLGQFYYTADGSIDPNSMMGMWNSFRESNPGWRNGAVWCVLPAADYPSNFFGEKPSREVPREEREATIRKKMDFLVQNGHEICNHTLYHARLDKAEDDDQVREWIGRGEDSIQVYLPENYDIVTLALPLGMWPENRALAWSGTWAGRPGQNRPFSYQYEGVMEVSGGAAQSPSPFDTSYDRHSINRFPVAPGHLERRLALYEKEPGRRFISDGDPNVISVPAGSEGRVDRSRWNGKEVRVVPASAPAPAHVPPTD